MKTISGKVEWIAYIATIEFFHNSRLITRIQQQKKLPKILIIDQGLNPDHLLSCQPLLPLH